MTAKHAEAEQKIVKITGELNTSEANVKKLEQEKEYIQKELNKELEQENL